jgi:hypothetical protein
MACEGLEREREVEKGLSRSKHRKRSGVLVMRCKRAGRGNGARIANADALRPMSAFAGKADITNSRRHVR